MYVTQMHCDTDHKARLNFLKWYLHEVHDEERGPKLLLLRCENRFQLSGYGPCQTMRFWSADDPVFSDGTSLRDVIIGMRLAMDASGVTGSILSDNKYRLIILIVVFPCMLITTQLLFQQNALVY
jgi:hypothetical protein